MKHSQPEIEEIKRALDDVFINFDFTPSRSEALEKLIQLRTRKTIWSGKEENDLRFSIDKFLEEFRKGKL